MFIYQRVTPLLNVQFFIPQAPLGVPKAPKICMAQGMARSAAAKATQPGPANQALSRSREASGVICDGKGLKGY